jgi:hypothetical protein
MKYLLICGMFAGLLLTPGSARATGFSITITFDENCNSLFTNTNGFSSALPCSQQQDPGPGGLAGALTYGLLNPPSLVTGDLELFEPDSEAPSDLVRFINGSAIFYSDFTDGADSLADIGLPTAFEDNRLLVTEVGSEGSNGFTYTPTAGQPGFVGGIAGPVTYVIQSDTSPSTPEPASAVLFLGVAGLGLARKYFVGRASSTRR